MIVNSIEKEKEKEKRAKRNKNPMMKNSVRHHEHNYVWKPLMR
jgi:hypothetical protein